MTSLPKGKIVVPVWSDDDEIKPLVNDDGRIPVSVESYTPSPNSQIHGWDGVAWRKLPILWGYSERWVEKKTLTVTVGGTNFLQTTGVLDGYVHVVDAIVTLNEDKTATHLKRLAGGGHEIEIDAAVDVGAATHDPLFPVGVCLAKDDYVKAYFLSCDVDDRLTLYVWGYKMKVAE